MLKATVFAALYGISNGYGNGRSGSVKMCCTANVAMSNSYSICEDVMNRYDESEQEYQCLNGKAMGKVGGVDRCKYAPCEDVGYCVDSRDSDFFDEMTVWEANENERRSLLSVRSVDQEEGRQSEWTNGWAMANPIQLLGRQIHQKHRVQHNGKPHQLRVLLIRQRHPVQRCGRHRQLHDQLIRQRHLDHQCGEHHQHRDRQIHQRLQNRPYGKRPNQQTHQRPHVQLIGRPQSQQIHQR